MGIKCLPIPEKNNNGSQHAFNRIVFVLHKDGFCYFLLCVTKERLIIIYHRSFFIQIALLNDNDNVNDSINEAT